MCLACVPKVVPIFKKMCRMTLTRSPFCAANVQICRNRFLRPIPVKFRASRIVVCRVGLNDAWNVLCDLMDNSSCAYAISRDVFVGVKNNYILEIFDPNLPIHYITFIGLQWGLRVVYSSASLLSKLIPKLAVLRRKGCLNIKFCFYSLDKAHPHIHAGAVGAPVHT